MGLWRKQGGGYLNGVNGTILGYKFEAKEWEGEGGKEGYHTLTMQVDLQQDGADAPVQQFLRAGFFYPEEMAISDDGLTLRRVDPDDDRPIVAEDSEAARFIQSVLDNDSNDTTREAIEGLNGFNFEPIVNLRVTFGRVRDEDTQIAIGKRKLGKVKAAAATREQLLEAGRRQDKKDKKKFYDIDYLVVTKVLGVAEAPAPKKGGAKAKPAAAAKAAPKAAAGKPAAKPAAKSTSAASATEFDLDELTTNTLVELLGASDGPIQAATLSSLVVKKAVQEKWREKYGEGARDAVRKRMTDEEFLGAGEAWTYDGSTREREIALA